MKDVKALKKKIAEDIKAAKCIIDAHTHVGVMYNNYLEFAYPYALSFEDLVIRMKFLGIDRSVIFPGGSSYFLFSGSDKTKESPLDTISEFPYQKENQSLLKEIFDIFPDHSDMAIPFMMFDPTFETEEQAKWLEELYQQYPVFGLKTVTSYVQSFVTDIEEKGKGILDFAKRHHLPITFHCSYHKGDPWAQVDDIIQIIANHPEINFCMAHSARFVKSILDKAQELPNCFVDLSAFKIHCDLAIGDTGSIPAEDDDRFQADYTKPVEVMLKLIETYPDTIIWGTDTPYHYFIQKFVDKNGKEINSVLTCDFDTEINTFNALPENFREQVGYTNTVKYLFS